MKIKRDAKVLSAVENQRPFKNIQPHKQSIVEKENWNSHVFISSPYKNEQIHHSFQKQQPLKVVRQTFTTSKNNEKAEVTFAGRPTMGGKTISSIQHLPATQNRMSSQELKLLSRRINPHEPLSSPHASPKKPPLPNLVRKRLVKEVPTKKKQEKAHYEYTCEPCNKVYKTRAGYSYHQDKCKYHKLKAASKAVIHCVCQQPMDDTATMIECVKCNRWLHLKCAGGVTKEENYCCPRCEQESDTIHLFNHLDQEDEDEEEQYMFQNGKTINLSALSQAKERGKNLFKEQEQEPVVNDFANLFAPSPELPSSVMNGDDFWNNDDLIGSSNTWCNEDLPSLLFSDNNPSFIDDFDIPSSPVNQADWFHFANFENDFSFDQ